MSFRLLAPALVRCVFLARPAPSAAGEAEGPPEKLYKLDLVARMPAEKDVTRDTRTVSAEVFLEKKSRLLYVGGGGQALAVAPAGDAAKGGKGAKRLHRLLLPVRKKDEK